MKLRVDEELGLMAVELGDDGPIRLRRPTIRQWADWTIQAQALQSRSAGVDSTTMRHEELELAGPVAALNWEMIRTLAAVRLPMTLEATDPRLVELADSRAMARLLAFWWECPLAPWDVSKAPTDDDGDESVERAPAPSRRKKDGDAEPRKISTGLPSGLGALSVIYQALSTIGMGAGFAPPDIDRMEVWQVAILLGRDFDPGGDPDGDLGGRVKHRGDGQEGERIFERDPDQPTFFGANSNRAAAWAWLQRKRAMWRDRAIRGQSGENVPPPRRRRKRRWNR